MNVGAIIGIIVGLIAIIAYVVWYMKSEHKKKHQWRVDAQIRAKEEAENKRKADILRRETLITKYGEELGNKILSESFFIGMTKDQLIDAKNGQPDKIEKEELKTKTKETWIYGNKTSGDVFVFENETLARFKDR